MPYSALAFSLRKLSRGTPDLDCESSQRTLEGVSILGRPKLEKVAHPDFHIFFFLEDAMEPVACCQQLRLPKCMVETQGELSVSKFSNEIP